MSPPLLELCDPKQTSASGNRAREGHESGSNHSYEKTRLFFHTFIHQSSPFVSLPNRSVSVCACVYVFVCVHMCVCVRFLWSPHLAQVLLQPLVRGPQQGPDAEAVCILLVSDLGLLQQ